MSMSMSRISRVYRALVENPKISAISPMAAVVTIRGRAGWVGEVQIGDMVTFRLTGFYRVHGRRIDVVRSIYGVDKLSDKELDDKINEVLSP